jgi:plastocyanin
MRITPIAMTALMALTALGAAAQEAAPPVVDERIEGICAEAEEQYVAMFGQPSAEAPVTIVKMYRNVFCPVELEVAAGTPVRWVNVERRTSHSVWFQALGLPESERLFPEEVVELTFDEPGDHVYLCGPHWETHTMIGRLVVQP